MRSATLGIVLCATLATAACAVPPGFGTSFERAKHEAKASDKLIFAFFRMDG